MNAQDAFKTWMLKVEIIGGAACLLVFVVCVAMAIVLIAKSRKREE